MFKIKDVKKLDSQKTITECPKCGGGLKQTYSSEIGFCPKCMQQFKLILQENKEK